MRLMFHAMVTRFHSPLATIKGMTRRHWLSLGVMGLPLTACAQSYPSEAEVAALNARRSKIGRPALTPADIDRLRRFRHLKGGGKYVDGFGVKDAVEILDQDGFVFFIGMASERANYRGSYGSDFGVPVALRATWRTNGPEVDGLIQDQVHSVPDDLGFLRPRGGIIVGDYTVPVADRIPQALLDDLPRLRNKHGMRFRL